jgi:hypothetical protein
MMLLANFNTRDAGKGGSAKVRENPITIMANYNMKANGNRIPATVSGDYTMTMANYNMKETGKITKRIRSICQNGVRFRKNNLISMLILS